MRNRKILSLSAILLGVMMCFSFNKVKASEITSVFDDVKLSRDNLTSLTSIQTFNTSNNVTLKLEESGYTDNNGKKIWKIVNINRDGKDYYCLNMNRGFGGIEGIAQNTEDEYSYSADLNLTDLNRFGYDTNKQISNEKYNKLIWILNNSYVRTNNTSYYESKAYKSLMKKLVSYKNNNEAYGISDNSEYNLTEDDIITAQKLAIWYYTNGYIVGGIRDSIGGVPSNSLTDGDGDVITYSRQEKLLALKDYFINNAESSYSEEIPTLELSNTRSSVSEDNNYYFVGPFKLTGENVSKINEITAKVNGKTTGYALLDSTKTYISGNDFSKVIVEGEKDFYLRFSKTDIQATTDINLEINYKYDIRTLTFMTDESDATNTQPVVLVKKEERSNDINTSAKIELVEVSVEKIWNDNENQDGKRPKEGIKVQLYEGNTPKGSIVTLTDNNLEYKWTKLLAGKAYAVYELDKNNMCIVNNANYNDYYSTKYDKTGNKTIITNTHTPEKININVNKVWNDDGDRAGKRGNYSVTLIGNTSTGIVYENTKNLSKDQLSCKWENLDKYKNGKEITYTIDETTKPEGYTKKIEGTEKTGFTITNTYAPEKINVAISKVWDDSDNIDKKRAAYEVTIVGKINNEEVYKDTKSLSKDQLNYTWENLYKYSNGKEIEYTVDETKVPEGYSKKIEGNVETGFIITNTHKITDLSLRKYITSINGNEITADNDNYRVPNIDTARLDDNDYKTTTAKYVHKKNPIVINSGNKVIYNITIYNEGQTDARATKITDQLPTGLRFERIITGGYTSEYDETTNRLIINKTGNENIPAYTGNGNLSSETVQVECSVQASPETEDKILTNIAWISEMKKGENEIINRDVDSNINDLDYNKDNMDNYEGKEYDDGYYVGQQDDDDFDRLILLREEQPVIENEYSVKILKVGEDGTTPLDGSRFEINNDQINGKMVLVSLRGTEIDNGKMTSTADLNLTYELREDIAPEGYIKIEDNKRIEINAKVELKDNNYEITEVTNNELEGITVSEENNVITIKVKNEKEVISGKYNVTLRKKDNSGKTLQGAKIKVNGTEYTLGTAQLVADEVITSEGEFTLDYALTETKAPEGYNELTETKNIKIKVKVEKIGTQYVVREAYLVDADGVKTSDAEIEVSQKDNTITIDVINTPIAPVEKEFDLALRKFITKVNDKELQREPVVDTSTIATTGTATYKHSKQPVSVQKGDIVTYTIRVYNEGELDGYVDEITDYLPDNLLPIISGIEGIDTEKYVEEIAFNSKYLWSIDNNNTIKTSITSKGSANGEVLYSSRTNSEDKVLLKAYNGGNSLDYIDVQIKCLVANSTEILRGTYLTNIAEITDSEDINGNHNDGKDSTINDVDHSNLNDYKNTEALKSNENSYIKGQQDDDDFEKLVIEVYDLSLRKYITGITRNGSSVSYGASREPIVDTTPLVNNISTTATYSHKKDPVEVRKGDIVTYTIRVYNEGTLDGIPAEITEYIPTYLTFNKDDSINKEYGWELVDSYENNGIGVLKTTYLKDTVLKAFSYQEGDNLDSTNNYGKDLKINFIVNNTPTMQTIMTNTSEISVYQYADKSPAIDRDSGEQWEIGILDYGTNMLTTALYENYVKTGEMTQEDASELVEYIKEVFNDYKPDYTSSDYGISKYLNSKGLTAQIIVANSPVALPDSIMQVINDNFMLGQSNEELTEKYIDYIDWFFQNYKGLEANKSDLSDSSYYYVGQEDDDDFEKLKLVYFDLALRKFITKVNGIDYNNRIPEVDTSKMGMIDEKTGEKITTATYTHTKEPVLLQTGNTVVYTIRVYNEGTISGYANEITDNIPEGLEYLPENEVNKQYKWTMIDENGEITGDISKAIKITTNYLSEENDKSQIISAYQEINGNIALDYKDVKVAFKVTEPSTSDRIVVNTAEISKASDEDIDSTPGNSALTEDDIDKEYVKVESFDLALKKWVTATKVIYNGKTKVTKTGFTPDSEEIAKVDLVGSQLKKTTVKFVYSIRVTNEGQVAGYATEIKDHIPSGLKFVASDNKDWTLQKDGTVTTDKLKDTLLQPGQSADVEITLTWKNSSTNMGVKTNWAEISADSGDDIDSTPNNKVKTEDDMDDAKVILSIKTGNVTMYIFLTLISVAILGGGTFLIKKHVINK